MERIGLLATLTLLLTYVSLQAHKLEPVNSMTIERLAFRRGFVHLENVPGKTDMVYVRLAKPLLRILATTTKESQGLTAFLKVLPGSARIGIFKEVELQKIFTTCRKYHGDIAETVQLLSLLTACAVYVLLTPKSRPELRSLADLRPKQAAEEEAEEQAEEQAKQQAGQQAKEQAEPEATMLEEGANVLRAEAEEVDKATAELCTAYEKAMAALQGDEKPIASAIVAAKDYTSSSSPKRRRRNTSTGGTRPS